MEKSTVRSTGAGVTVKSVSAMKKRRGSEIFEAPLKDILDELPEIGEFLRDRGVGCEGCHLFHLANLREVFSCYKLCREEFNETLLKMGIEI